MLDRKTALQNSLTSGFFGFWIRKYRLSYLLVIVLILMGIVAAIQIPKESSPNVELGIISITVSYPGASPADIDSLITEKISKQIENVEGIDAINATSSLGFSSTTVSLKTHADASSVLNDIRNKVSSLTLPSAAKTPNITNIETNTDRLFSFSLYKKTGDAPHSELVERAEVIKDRLERLSTIKSAELTAGSMSMAGAGGANQGTYEIQIRLSDETLKAMNLTIGDISQAISGFNQDHPIGNFSIQEKNYDYRIEGKYENISEFLKTPLTLPK